MYTTKETFIEPQRFPIWVNLLLSIGFIFLAYVAAIIIQLTTRISGDIFLIFLLLSVVLAAVLPHLNYSRRYLALGAPFITLTIWFLVLGLILPHLVKPYDIAKAQRIVPKYPALQPARVTFNPGAPFNYDPSVGFEYSSKDPQTDYMKLHDFYKDTLGRNGWTILSETNYVGEKSVTFWKLGSQPISVGYNEKAEFPLGVFLQMP